MENIEEKKSKKGLIISIIIISIVLIGTIVAYARYIGTTGLKVIETQIVNDNLPPSFIGFKVVTIADIHYGRTTTDKDIKKLVKKANELKPDIVIFLGDIFDKDIKLTDKDITLLKEEFKNIDASLGKYAVKGDNDYTNIENFETIFKYADFDILDNSNTLLYYKGNTPIKIVGTTSLLKGNPNIDEAFKNEDENEYFTILASHEPNTINEIKEKKVDVMFTAHSLGGLVNIPLIGSLFKFKGSDNYLSGEYKVNKTTMYVNSGIGTHKYSFRWFNKPSINLYRLYKN